MRVGRGLVSHSRQAPGAFCNFEIVVPQRSRASAQAQASSEESRTQQEDEVVDSVGSPSKSEDVMIVCAALSFISSRLRTRRCPAC